MTGSRVAYAAGVLVGGVTATFGWSWIARHPTWLRERHERQVRAYNATHGPGACASRAVSAEQRGVGIRRPPEPARPLETPWPDSEDDTAAAYWRMVERRARARLIDSPEGDLVAWMDEDDAWQAQDELARARGWRFDDEGRAT